MCKKIRIAIDGPAAAGKSTIAKEIAKKYQFTYIDTGAMYRCVGYFLLKNGMDIHNEEAIINQLENIHITLTNDNKVYLNGEDVTHKIRSNEVTESVSLVSSYKSVRDFLVFKQREMAKDGNVVLDGRDIGTVVIPDAELKIYQVADVKVRALRRHKENLEKGIPSSLDELEKMIEHRDYEDTHRKHSPLKKAKDAKEIDTSYLSIEEIVDIISKYIEELIV